MEFDNILVKLTHLFAIELNYNVIKSGLMKKMTQITELKITKSQIERLASNLRALLTQHHITENEVAQALNIPHMTVRRLASGETTDPRISTLKLIADYFKITVDSLISDQENKPTVLRHKNMPKFVPVLDWIIATKIRTIKDIDLTTWKKWQPVTLNSNISISDTAFALESRPSMHSRFPQGTLFIIEPNITSSDGDIVLLRIKDTNELSLRELMIDPPEKQLYPIVPGSNVLVYSENAYDIIGVVVLTLLYNRRITD